MNSIEAKNEACKLAKRITSEEGSYLDAVVQLASVGNYIYGQCWDTEFHVFGLIASDTDHLPLQHVRKRCSDELLAKVELEIEATRLLYKESVNEACKAILAKHQDV